MPHMARVQNTVTPSVVFDSAFMGLLLMALVTALLAFPLKAAADPQHQEDLLYALLGSLDYSADGRFIPVTDPAMQKRLPQLVHDYDLATPAASAYIIDTHRSVIVWSPAAEPLRFEYLPVAADYALQTFDTGTHSVMVQPFWRMDAGVRREFRMVVALPK